MKIISINTMRSTALFCTLSMGLMFCSCNPRITTELINVATPLDVNQYVAVYELDKALPSNSEIIGEVNIDDAGLTTNCSYDYVVELAKVEARKAGGNALKITRHITPDLYSSCHRISAQILLVDAPVSGQMVQKNPDALNSQPVAASKSFVKMADPRIRFSLYGGLSNVLAKNPDVTDAVLDQYSKNLESGYNLGSDFTYYFSNMSGVGIKCNMLRTSNSLNGVTIYDDYGHSQYGTISDDITFLFVGPSLNYRIIGTDKKGALYFSASAGYSGYYNKACVIDRLILSGSTLGSSIDVGYDMNLSKKVALGLKLSLTTGVLKKVTINDGYFTEQYYLESDSYISLNHIDFSIGFSFIR